MEIEKNFLPQYKLYECAVYNDKRPALSNIHFSNGYAMASNGYIAVRALIKFISTGFDERELSYLEGKSIDAKSFKTILSYPHVTITEKGIEVNDDAHPLFFGFNRQQHFKFPDVESIVDVARKELVDGLPVRKTGINGKMFSKLMKAMNATNIRLDFNADKAILVRDIGCEAYIEYIEGIIMPIITD